MASKFRLRKNIKKLNNVIKQLEENQLSYLKAKTAAQGKIYGCLVDKAGNTSCNSATNVPWDEWLERSDSSHFGASSGEVTFNIGGVYEIVYTVNTDISSNGSATRSTSKAYLQKYSSGSWSTVNGSESYMYNRLEGRGVNTAASAMILTINTGDKIRIRVERHSGSDSLIIIPGSSLTMTTL